MQILNRVARSLKPLVEHCPLVAQTYRHVRDLKFLNRDPVLTPFGFYFSGDPSMENGTFEAEEVKIVKKILEHADVFINVGANYGYYCCLALQAGVRTVAFEPIDLNLRLLYKNVQANGWQDKIEIFPLALAGEAGLVEIYGAKTGASLIKGWAGISEAYKQFAPLSTLDKVLGTRFTGMNCFILVDIEGAEFLMLQGAKQFLIQEPKPIWMVEICISEHQPEGIHINPHLKATFGTFWDNGYAAYTANERLEKVTPQTIEQICSSGIDTLHTHNFLFLEPGRGLPT